VSNKPLSIKAYGSIPHLPLSRLGEGDHSLSVEQSLICTKTARSYKDVIIVQEKLDGSCCGVAKLSNESIVPLTRSGYAADTSPYKQHKIFYDWVLYEHKDRFENLLEKGERLVGEWILQQHGTRYKLQHEPFVIFDIFDKDNKRIPYFKLLERVIPFGFTTPKLISYGMPISVKDVIKRIKVSGHGAIDEVEGAVWRVETDGKFNFITKFVHHDKEDGKYLKDGREIWNENYEEFIMQHRFA